MPPHLYGLVLAGGEGRRMGGDKGALELDGQAQAVRAHALLSRFVSRAYVSVRAAQAAREPYPALPLVHDPVGGIAGPAAGLLAAWDEWPSVALLVLAVDLPFVDAPMLEQLVRSRDPGAIATAFQHPDGTPEPVCTIWEPAARDQIACAPGPGASLRRILEHAGARLIDAPDPARLVSLNTPADVQRARRAFDL